MTQPLIQKDQIVADAFPAGTIEYVIPNDGITTIQIDASNITLSDATVTPNTSGRDLIKKDFLIFREGNLQFSNQYAYSSSTGTVTPTIPYNSTERLKFVIMNTIP